MTETQRRIEAYKAALPDLKERVIAVALLLVMSAAMMTSASFAWLTISRAPEVTAVNTTVAANGNLEIALATGDGTIAPGESKVGDSFAADGQNVVAANLTWGNLVNLSDPSYGLDNLVLRPARLNENDLLGSPLYGAVYKGDGRIEKLGTNFGFGTWNVSENKFLINDEHGVRAVSSTVFAESSEAQMAVAQKEQSVKEANTKAGQAYLAITGNSEWMNSLASIMGKYMTARVNAGQDNAEHLTNPDVSADDIQNLYDIFGAFIGAYELQAQAMVELVNYQLYLINTDETGTDAYDPYTYEKLMATDEAGLKKDGLFASGLNTIKSDLTKLETGRTELEPFLGKGTVKWVDSGINDIVNNLMNVGTCTVDGMKVNSIGATAALGFNSSDLYSAVITNGALKNFESINGEKCEVGKDGKTTVSATGKRFGFEKKMTIKVCITTDATGSKFLDDVKNAEKLNKGGKAVQVAEDTYGLAVDLWVRTNAEGSYLVLEGNLITITNEIDAMGKDGNGNDVYLYSYTRMEPFPDVDEEGNVKTDADGNTIYVDQEVTYELYYLLDENNNKIWYNSQTHGIFELDEGKEPVLKKEIITTVTGYEGENRVWAENDLLSSDVTTQGSGSCYVYYADTPEDQARSLELLKSFKVAFVDADGKLLAKAVMDTEHSYEDNGRVTVPLILDPNNVDGITYVSENGEEKPAVTRLIKNEATRITAMVYLDGTDLTNENVLSSADIQGQLNIQFGTSKVLEPIENEELANKKLSVSASVSETEFNYDEASDENPMTTTVSIKIEGDQPNNVTAFFIRKINANQGSRGEVFTLNDDDKDGVWTADYTFDMPGIYVLRTVSLDGQEYVLSTTPTVTVKGFTISKIECEQGNPASCRTTDGYYTVDVELYFASNDEAKMPTTVQGRYKRAEDGATVNVNFAFDKTCWKGSATFQKSGEYTLEYLILNGEYTGLEKSKWLYADVTLGMRVEVETDSPVEFPYEVDKLEENQRNLKMRVKIMDDTGEEIQGLPNVQLYYLMRGSSLPEKGMNAPLVWNAAKSCYECTFQSKIGMYYFSKVTVGGDTLGYATKAPEFRISSTEPPVFNSDTSVSYQFAPPGGSNKAVMRVKIDNCPSATVFADILREGSTETIPVEGGLNDSGDWVFELPAIDNDGNYDGTYTIEQIRIWGVYDENGEPYTEERPFTYVLTEDEKVPSKVVSKVKATVAPIADNELGKTGNNIDGAFMQEHTVSGITVTITDADGEPIQGTISASLVYSYDGSSKDYGGYSSNSISAQDLPAISFTKTNGTTLTQKDPITVQYAGEYTAHLTCTIDVPGSSIYTKPISSENIDFKIYSVTPTVTITGITPTGTYSVDTNTSGTVVDTSTREVNHTEEKKDCDGNVTGTTTYYDHTWTTNAAHKSGTSSISADKLTATVYFQCIHSNDATYNGGTNTTSTTASNERLHAYYSDGTKGAPTVTLTLNGISGFTSATLNMSNNANIYTGVTYTGSGLALNGTWETTGGGATYSWTTSGTSVTRNIGYVWGQKARWDDSINATGKKTPAGTITAETLTVVYGGNTYTFTIPKVTINNPY